MTEFKIDDIVIGTGYSDSSIENHRKILSIHTFTGSYGSETRLWVADMDGHDRGTVGAANFRKVEPPKFEAGKTYRRIKEDGSPSFYQNHLATVFSTNGKMALGWGEDGSVWLCPQHRRDNWEEVGASINADQHKNLKSLGVVMGESDR